MPRPRRGFRVVICAAANVAAELRHADLEGDARAQARLLEEHQQRLLLQRVGVPQRRRLQKRVEGARAHEHTTATAHTSTRGPDGRPPTTPKAAIAPEGRRRCTTRGARAAAAGNPRPRGAPGRNSPRSPRARMPAADLHVDGHVEDAHDLGAAQAADLRHVPQRRHLLELEGRTSRDVAKKDSPKS